MNRKIVVRICQALCVLFIYAGYTVSAHALKLEAGDILADFNIRVKADTGEQSLLGFGAIGSSRVTPGQMALDSDGSVLALRGVFFNNQAIIRYNLTDGSQQTIFTTGSVIGLFGMAVDSGGQIFGFDNSSVYKVDRLTGQSTILAGFFNIKTIALDINGDVLVGESLINAISRVDPVTGLTSQIASGGLISGVRAIAVDASGDYIVLNESANPALFVKIDRNTGSQSDALSAPLQAPQGGSFFPTNMMIDTNGDFIVSTQSGSTIEGVHRVVPATGVVTTISSALTGIVDLMAASVPGEILVSTADLDLRLSKMNLSNGNDELLIDASLDPDDVMFWPVINNRGEIFLVDNNRSTISKIDPKTAKVTEVSSGGLLSSISGIAVGINDDLIVRNRDARRRNDSIIRVNTTTGTQSLIVSGIPNSFAGFALDKDGNIYTAPAFISPASPVIRINSVTGSQTTITPSTSTSSPANGIAIDDNGDVIIAVGSGGPAGIFRLDAATGSISTVAGSMNNISNPTDVAIAADGTIVVANSVASAGSIISVNPINGDESVLASGGLFAGFTPRFLTIVPEGTGPNRSADIVIDFGAFGLWARMNDASWLRFNNASPTQVTTADMDGNGEDDVIAVFANGIFVKRNLGSWTRLHNSIPDAMSVGDLDNNGQDDVVIDFGTFGLYVRMNDTSWVRLNNASPSQIATGDIDGNGADDVIAAFDSGIFVKRNLGSWTRLHTSIPEAMSVGDLDNNGQDDVVIDFGGIGLWVRMNDSSWLKLSNSSPDLITTGDIDGNGADDVIATFGTSIGGSWQKLNLGSWTRLNANAADDIVTGDIDASGQEDIIASFGSTIGGIYVKRNQGAWSKFHNVSPDDLATGHLDSN